MKQNKKGFSLIEFTVYFFITIVVFIMLFNFFLTTNFYVQKQEQQCNTCINLSTAHMMLQRDIFASPAERSAWHVLTNTEIVWRSDKKACGWVLDDGNLYRIEGSYHNGWQTKKKSLVLKNCSDKVFHVVYDSAYVQSVAFGDLVIPLKNGVIR